MNATTLQQRCRKREGWMTQWADDYCHGKPRRGEINRAHYWQAIPSALSAMMVGGRFSKTGLRDSAILRPLTGVEQRVAATSPSTVREPSGMIWDGLHLPGEVNRQSGTAHLWNQLAPASRFCPCKLPSASWILSGGSGNWTLKEGPRTPRFPATPLHSSIQP